MGDLICLLPAIQVLGERYPTIEWELMARAELVRLAARRTPIARGHSIDRREMSLLFSEERRQPDGALEFFHQFARIECFFAADNAGFRSALGQVTPAEVSFYPFRPPGPGHVAEDYLAAIGASSGHALRAPLELLPTDMFDACRRLNSLGIEPRRFVLIFPGSGSARKNWPAENFSLLAERIRLIHPVLVVLGPAEVGLEAGFRARSVSMLDDLELGELAAIAHLARCFIGNDSGVCHLAAAAGTRGLVLFGPTDPERWRPLGDVRVIRKEPLANLSVDEVWKSAAELVEAVATPKP